MKSLRRLVLSAACLACSAGVAEACACDPSTPEAGFARAQYVFTGKVVEAGTHTWMVEIDRVWKGRDKLRPVVKLMDVYAEMDCAFFFKLGQSYLFFTILAKGNKVPFYHPQVCNWSRPLRSTLVPAAGNGTMWLEDLIVRDHGPGEPPLPQNP